MGALYQVFPIHYNCALTYVLHSGECVVKDHMVLGGICLVLMFNTRANEPAWNGGCPR